MKKIKIDKNNALALIIGLLSVGNILLQLKVGNNLSIINSIIGLAGVTLFFLQKDTFKYLIWIWIAAQVIIINETIVDAVTHTYNTKDIFNLAQLFQLKLGFSISGTHNQFSINFNLLVILYFFLFRKLKITALVGKSFRILILKGNHNITFDEGLYVTLKKRLNIGDDENWLLGDLSSKVTFNDKKINKVLVRTNNGELTDSFRIVYDGQELANETNSILNFDRADWIIWE